MNIEKINGLKIEKLSKNSYNDMIKLSTKVFTHEQNIPQKLIPINKDLQQIYWCAKIGDDIVGIVASWFEDNIWHWGRFAVDKKFRGLGIGKKLAIFSFKELFNMDVFNIYIEARDITVKMLSNYGCTILGKPIDFFGEPVTPILIKKEDFMHSIKS